MPTLDKQETQSVVNTVDNMLLDIRTCVQQGRYLGMSGVRFPGVSMGKVIEHLECAALELKRYRDAAEQREPILSGGVNT